jgi:F-type H+-transporting ATPase subunit epsilon
MAHTPFPVEVLTPEGEVFNGEVEMISTRTTLGEIGILANHAALLGALEPTELRLYTSETEIKRYAQSEGYIQVGENKAMLLVQEIEPAESLDAAALREKLHEAESAVEAAGEGTEARRLALRDRKRWAAFLKIAEGN